MVHPEVSDLPSLWQGPEDQVLTVNGPAFPGVSAIWSGLETLAVCIK